jgi:metallopeptidase family M12-like protein/pre-peptidase
MQYPGKCISNFSRHVASPSFCIFLLLAAIVISGFLPRVIDAARPAISTIGKIQQETAKLVGNRLQQRDDPEIAKTLKKYDLVKLDRVELASQMDRNGRILLETSAGNFDLELTPHDLRSQDYQSQSIGADGIARRLPITPVKTYKGRVNGSSRAQARMTLTKMGIEGIVITGSDRYFLQPARSLSKTANEDEFVFYSGNDTTEKPGTCGVTLADEVAARERLTKESGKTVQAESFATADTDPLSPMRVVRLATDADAEYVSALGGAVQANDQILSIMNQVDGIYQVDIGLTFQIVFQNAWTNAATDPYAATDPGSLLNEFSNYWNNHFAGMPSRNLAHLWTDKDMSGTVGLAYLGVVCRDSSDSYAWSRRTPNIPTNPITDGTVALTAHEIGHNFHAVHTDIISSEIPVEIVQSCRGSIMLSFVTSSATFCPFSQAQIKSFVAGWATCLSDSSTSPPAYPPCAETPLNSSLFASGTLAESDCRSPSRGVSYFADRYSFDGQAGQRLSITMNHAGNTLDPQLYLIGPENSVIAVESATNPNIRSARIPSSGSFTLPLTGKYIIETTSFVGKQVGDYSLAINLDDCVLSVSPSIQPFPASGGSGTINVTATGGGCGASYQFTKLPGDTAWISTGSNSGTGSQQLNFTVQPNSNNAGRRAFLVVGTAFGTLQGGLRIPVTQSGTTPDCSVSPISFGQTIAGALTLNDCQSPIRGNFFFADRYAFTAAEGQQIAINAWSLPVDSFLTLIGPSGNVIMTDDEGAGRGNARIPAVSGWLTVGLAGTYIIEITSFPGGAPGSYVLTLSTNGPQTPPTLLTDGSDDHALAFDSVTRSRDPFPLTTPFNFSADGQTRVALFATNLLLFTGETAADVTAAVEDNQSTVHPATVEFVGQVPFFEWLTQVTIKVPANLPSDQDVRLSITLHGQTSNKVRFHIK